MNIFIKRLKLLGVGCSISSLYIGCILYADDILLLCPSVTGLQDMLDKCSETAKYLSLEFNVDKCHCVAVGKRCSGINSMTLCGNSIEWCDAVKYLGVYLQGGRSLKFDINPAKRTFYAACNSIFLNGSSINEIALLHLQETYSLPILMYATPALHLNDKQTSELNACWNSVIHKVFGYHKWESVSAVLLGLGRLNFKHLVMLRKVKFYWHLYCSRPTYVSKFLIVLF